jgi:predicted nuclease of predicted toxin-antitoxin system
MKFLVDMNLSPVWVAFLAEAEHESVHWSDVGLATASDMEILHWAAERDYVLLTADLDFGAILAALQDERPSVVQVRSDDLSPRAIGGSVLAALSQARQELVDGALVSVEVTRARLRILPLKSEGDSKSD